MDAIPPRLAAALADHYRLERELGLGGMATVYAAEDLKHHRRVAIKVLRPDLAAAVGPERFQDEIEIAARLHHPHIVPVYDSGEADGFLYYVMPLVEGQSLRERLQEGRPIATSDVVRILEEVADALAHAHAHGLVHRDIKPGNIMMSGRHAMVMDFGIAKAIRDAGSRRSSTSIGLAMGTPEYMSPEQARGDADLDYRSDIYSLGVVGYELLTGRPPFAGGSAESILTRHITQPPAPIADARPDTPPALASVILRALAKSPAERWPSADAMRNQLEPMVSTTSGQMAATQVIAPVARRNLRPLAIAVAVLALAVTGWMLWKRSPGGGTEASPGAAATVAATATAAKPAPDAIPDLATDPSIAVLPFANMSSDKEQQFFSDGISEELLNLLSRIPELRVIARTSSFQFRDEAVGIQDIARKLHVAAVLEGSVRRSGDKVRITAQLIRARDGSHLWSETYDRTLDDVFKVQDEIASKVVEQLQPALLGGAPKLGLVDPQVYPLLLQADALSVQGTDQARTRAIELYRQVTERSPREARAWAGLARNTLNTLAIQGKFTPEGTAKVREYAQRALELDPQLAIVHTYLARLALDDGDLASAAKAFQSALALAPTSAGVWANTATLLRSLGRLEDAIRVRRWVARMDPANPTAHATLCFLEVQGAKPALALESCRTALGLAPDYNYLHSYLSIALLRLGRLDEALVEARQEPDEAVRLALEAEIHSLQGDRSASDGALQKLEAKFADYFPTGVAEAYAVRGQADQAFAWLERARRVGDSDVIGSNTNPLLANLHADPRWLPFLRSLKLAPEQLAQVPFDVKLPE